MLSAKFYQSKLTMAASLVLSTSFLAPLVALASPVKVAGQQVFDLTTGGASRAATVQKNLDNALVATTNRLPSAAKVVYVKGQPVVTVGGFYVTTVDAESAKAMKTTPALLAQRWVEGLKSALKNNTSVEAYVSQLTNTGDSSISASTTTTSAGSYPFYKQGRAVYIPAGMMIPIALSSGISTETAQAGDRIEGRIAETVNLGDATIPQGSTITGVVTSSEAGKKLGQSGKLGIKFTDLRTPEGQVVPITAHIVGGIGRYDQLAANSGIIQGETAKDKMKQALVRGAIGAGSGAVLGTAIGAIAGHGRGAGRGAVAGTAIGGALGVAESFLMRKGADVKVKQGQTFKLQLDAPTSLSIIGSSM